MRTACCLDWYSGSCFGDATENLLSSDAGFTVGRPIDPIPRYPGGFALEPAGRIFLGRTETQGSLVTFSGSELGKLRTLGYGGKQLLRDLGRFLSPTRLDFAMDILFEVRLSELEERIRADDFRQSFRVDPLLVAGLGPEAGYTIYFGSASGNQRIRIYDKARELKLLEIAWKRVELQSRRKRAKLLAEDLITHNFFDAGREAIQNVVDFPTVSWWRDALAHDRVVLATAHRSEPRFQIWLRTQVLPAIKKHAQNPEERPFLRDFSQEVAKAVIGELTSDPNA